MVKFNNPRNYRLVDNSLVSDINRCNMVSGTSESTLNTIKCIAVRSVFLIDTTTQRTCAGCISWINKLDRDTSDSRFILDKLSELIKSPRIMATTLSFRNRYLVTNTRKVFEGNSPSSVFGFSHNRFRDTVVNISMESLFFTRQLFKMLFSTLRSSALEATTKSRISHSGIINLFTTKNLSIAIRIKVNNSQINTKSTNRIKRCFFGNINNNSKIKNTVPDDKVNLTSTPAPPRSDLL